MPKLLGVRFPTYGVGWAVKKRVLKRGPPIKEWNVFKGDVVEVLVGKDAGKQGIVRFAIPHWKKVVVEGLNVLKKHTKATQARPLGIINILGRLRIEHVALVDPLTGQACTVVMKDIVDPDTGVKTRARISKESGAIIERAPEPPISYTDGDFDTPACEASKVSYNKETARKTLPLPPDCFV